MPGIATESLLELYKYIAYNEEYRFLTEIYEKILIDRGVDLSGIKVASHINVKKVDYDYIPPNANAKEYQPEIVKNLDFELYDCEGEYGKYNQSLDEILVKYWDDPTNKQYDIIEHPSRGILPSYSQSCLAKRAIAKKEAGKAEPGSALQKAWDGAQNGLKVHANSGYGVTGSDEDMGKLGDITLSATITGYGRLFLEFVKNWFCKGTGKVYNIDYFDLVEKKQKTLIFDFSGGGKNYGGDTDSFFNVLFGIDWELVKRMGEKEFCKFVQMLADEANSKLPPAVRLMFEKIMFPFCSVNKKRYAYVNFDQEKITYMGLESKRRDNAEFCRQVQIKTLELLLLKKDVPGAIAFVREKSRQLLEGEIEVNELIVTKQYYRTDYKNDTLPHLIVVKKTLHRGETPYELGQRVPYVIVIDKDVKTKSLNAEDPTYAMVSIFSQRKKI